MLEKKFTPLQIVQHFKNIEFKVKRKMYKKSQICKTCFMIKNTNL